jgi:hypothetical protein
VKNNIAIGTGKTGAGGIGSLINFSEVGDIQNHNTAMYHIEFRNNYTCSWRQAGEMLKGKYRIDGSVLTIYDIDNPCYIPFAYQIEELTATRLVLKLDGGIWFQGRIELKRDK